ncbi:hypothetical protein MVEG_02940 [Podila verticillata NRRL 6337]|nr:hypothetical protein MVEG_02940 [Podila verticillata NRRL 6337]
MDLSPESTMSLEQLRVSQVDNIFGIHLPLDHVFPSSEATVVETINGSSEIMQTEHGSRNPSPTTPSSRENANPSSLTDCLISRRTGSAATAPRPVLPTHNPSSALVPLENSSILPKDNLSSFDDAPDCAICLDKIVPLHHAKATLACKHEFHLSCISMAFAMGKEMICPLCRYLHKDQPFMTLEADMDHKLNPANRRSQQPHHRLHTPDTLSSHEHPTSGTVLSMMPSLTETFLGPQAGTIQSSGICLKTSTWLLLYALPFTVAVAFLGFVLGQVETLWSKISCMIGSAICYMACWALVVAVMDPDHESRTILMSMESAHAHAHRNDESHSAVSTNDEERSNSLRSRNSSTINLLLEDDRITEGYSTARMSNLGSTGISRRRRSSSITNGSGSQSASSSTSLPQDNSGDDPLVSTNMLFPFLASSTSASTTSSPILLSLSRWTNSRYAQELQNRVLDLAEILDDFPDTIGEW